MLAVKYRRRQADEVGANIHGSTALEVIWTAIPLLIAMVMFVWGTSVYFALAKPPAEAMEVYIIGKRWMWKAQHLTGHREINQLHVPVGTPVKLLISSEDVIHSYYIPAFRQKIDAVPGKTTTMWFEASKAGHLPAVLRRVLRHAALGDDRQGRRDGAARVPAVAQRRRAGRDADLEPASRSSRTLGCVTCHRDDGKGRGPSLVGVFGKPQQLANGTTVIADESVPARVDPQPAGEDGAGLSSR